MMNEMRIENFLYPYVRFFNALTNGVNADFYVGNSLVAANVTFGDFSPYIKATKGRQNIFVTASGDKSNVLATLDINFGEGDVYTVSVLNDGNKPLAYGINEPVKRSDLQYGHIRICQLSADLGKADIIANQYKILGDIDYLEISKYICISPGRYDFAVKRSGEEKVTLNVSGQTMRPGIYNTLYIIGLADSTPKITGVLSVDAASYNGYYL